jgi:ABC-2 type transport system permease protein
VSIAGAALLTLLVLPYVAVIASAGRGYLAPFGWIMLTIALAQVAAVTGWGDWFPWAIPLFSAASGPRAIALGLHSYVVMAAACAVGLALTYWWWREADQTR